MLEPTADTAVPVSIAYTLLYIAFVENPKIDAWKHSMSRETICRERDLFVERLGENDWKSLSGWEDLCSSEGWASMIQALKTGVSISLQEMRAWLHNMELSIKDTASSEAKTSPLNQCHQPQGAQMTNTSHVRLQRQKRGPPDSQPSASLLSVPTTGSSYSGYSSSSSNISHSPSYSSISPFNSYAAITPANHFSPSQLPQKHYGNMHGNIGDDEKQKSTAADQLAAFEAQMEIPYEVIPPFPITLPLDHPQAYSFYTDLLYRIPQDPQFLAVLSKTYDKEEALGKFDVKPKDPFLLRHQKEEHVAQILNAVVEYLAHRWSTSLISEVLALSRIKFHSDGEIRPTKDTLKTEEGIVPDIYMTYGDCTTLGDPKRPMKFLSHSYVIAVGERHSLPKKNTDIPFRKVFLYARRLFVAQPTRQGVFAFYVDSMTKAVPEPAVSTTDAQFKPQTVMSEDSSLVPSTPALARDLPQIVLTDLLPQTIVPPSITDTNVLSLIFALVFYDREGQTKSDKYSVDEYPSRFLSHLFMLTGIFHFQYLWDSHQVIRSRSQPPNCFFNDESPAPSERQVRIPTINRMYGVDIHEDQRIAAQNFGMFGRATNVWKTKMDTVVLKSTYANLPIGERGIASLPDEISCHIKLSYDKQTVWTHLCEAKKLLTSRRTDSFRAILGILSPEPRILSHFQLNRFGNTLFDEALQVAGMIDRGVSQGLIDAKKKECFDALSAGLKGEYSMFF